VEVEVEVEEEVGELGGRSVFRFKQKPFSDSSGPCTPNLGIKNLTLVPCSIVYDFQYTKIRFK
jgi:hypothetical protein